MSRKNPELHKTTSHRAPPKTKSSRVTGGGNQDADQLDENTIRIRMYRVGFGDCFLLSLPASTVTAAGPVQILVDCGVHSGGDIGTIERAVDDIASATNKKLAIIIATHAHRDHISGFGKFGDTFSTFKIGEVWLPWTWNPDDPQAVKIQKKQAALIAQLDQHFRLTGADPIAANAVSNLTGNENAMKLLRSGFGATTQVRYMKAEGPVDVSIPGLSVQILGPPPPDNDKFLKEIDPPAGEYYLRISSEGGQNVQMLEPFLEKWKLQRDAPELAGIQLSARGEKQLQQVLVSPLSDLAFSIDQARNNESLVTLFEYRGKHLLFPGDAQYGNWEWWLQNLQPDTILPQIDFLKVAHHGSINATPKSALDEMSEGRFAAMVSTQSKPFPSIPRVPLMSKLNEKTEQRIVRSDWIPIQGAPAPSPGTEPPTPSTPPAGFTEGPFWYDYLIKL
jgi:beta-lactamase superfamily II metal-dependent hydrolase